MRAQEMREAKRRRPRTPRATQPVCARISKMLPIKMSENRGIMSAPREKQILSHKFTVAYGSNGVKRIEMRMCKEEFACGVRQRN
jgi:hypothetical protein